MDAVDEGVAAPVAEALKGTISGKGNRSCFDKMGGVAWYFVTVLKKNPPPEGAGVKQKCWQDVAEEMEKEYPGLTNSHDKPAFTAESCFARQKEWANKQLHLRCNKSAEEACCG